MMHEDEFERHVQRYCYLMLSEHLPDLLELVKDLVRAGEDTAAMVEKLQQRGIPPLSAHMAGQAAEYIATKK